MSMMSKMNGECAAFAAVSSLAAVAVAIAVTKHALLKDISDTYQSHPPQTSNIRVMDGFVMLFKPVTRFDVVNGGGGGGHGWGTKCVE